MYARPNKSYCQGEGVLKKRPHPSHEKKKMNITIFCCVHFEILFTGNVPLKDNGVGHAVAVDPLR